MYPQVANGLKQEKGALIDPLTELTISKSVELFTEGIPAVAIQVAAAIYEGRISQMQLLSLVVSIVMSGFTSAQISYDFDIDPDQRSRKPDFYGYVPDGSNPRTICFCSLISIASCMLTIKTLGLVLLSSVSSTSITVYFAIEIGESERGTVRQQAEKARLRDIYVHRRYL